MEKNIKILVAAHKADPNIKNDNIFMPIHVGKALHPDIDLGFQGDDTGNNISDKNPSYCELTAIYWAWKNLKNVDIIGLAHYRRYLNITSKAIETFLSEPGMILPHRFHCRYDNYTNLVTLLTHEEAIIAIDTLLKMYPDVRPAVRKYFYQSNKYTVFNMFITDWKTFNQYCEFLFPYLEELEMRFKSHSFNRLKRNIGYVAEALIGVWLEYKNVRVKYVETLDMSSSIHKKNIKNSLRNLQRDLGFSLLYMPKYQNIYYYIAAVQGLKNQGVDVQEL